MASRARGYRQDWEREEFDETYDAQYPDDDTHGGVQLDHCKLYITNINRALNEEGLVTAFSKYGTLVKVYVSRDPTKRYALITFETPGEAKLAMMKLNKTEPLKLNIHVAHKKNTQDQKEDGRKLRHRESNSYRDDSSVSSKGRRKQDDFTNGDNLDVEEALCDEDLDFLDKKNRQRVPNFTADEKILLAKLVNDKKNIIENKMTDGKSVARKKAAWTSIEKEFNSHSNVHKRDTLTLKRAWDNLKAMARKTRATERGNIIRTGGGLPPSIPHSQESIVNMVEEAVPSLICEVKNDFDSDGVRLCNTKEQAHPLNEQDCDLQIIVPPEVQEEPLKKTDGESISVSEKILDSNTPTRKASDFVRKDGALRLKILETKKRMELQILKLKLDTQEKKNKTAEMLLEAAKLEVEFQKKRLSQLLP